MKSLYCHIPFCEKKCFYCSFAVTIGQDHRIDEYLDCMAAEMQQYRGEFLETVYLGGGTPSQMSAPQIKKLITVIRDNFDCSRCVEWTMEANPESLDFEKAKFLKEIGINRVSLGIQSLQDKYLKILGRCHGSKLAVSAYENLKKAGHANINLDLMFGFPGQTIAELQEDVQAIIRLGSDHLSLYSLTIEPNSRFFTRQVALPKPDIQSRQYELIVQWVEKAGFLQYEVSNFAIQGKVSRHTLNYWLGKNYIGLGMGAHSHVDGKRWWNHAKFNSYIFKIKESGAAVEGSEKLSSLQRFMELVLFGLRMNEGVHLKNLQEKTGECLSHSQKQLIGDFIKEGLMAKQEEYLKVTAQGRVVLDEICARLI